MLASSFPLGSLSHHRTLRHTLRERYGRALTPPTRSVYARALSEKCACVRLLLVVLVVGLAEALLDEGVDDI
eukprot:1636821-Prymnesium_polylepis.1